MKVLAPCLIALALSSAARAETLVTSCTANLSVISPDPNDHDLVKTQTTTPFEATVNGFSHSTIVMPLGDYTLYTSMMMTEPQGGSTFEPTLEVELYKGNPVQGQINFGEIKGLALDTRPVGIPLSLSGMAFVDTHVDGKYVSRIDYTCGITRQ